MVYVLTSFAWIAFVLLGIALIVVFEPVWNREAQLRRARTVVGCRRRTAQGPRSRCHALQVA